MRSLAHLRLARLADAGPIADLLGRLGPESVEEALEHLLERHEALLLVAENSRGELVAFLHASLQLRLNECDYARVETLCLREDYRRNGLSRKLLDRAEQWAAEFGCQRICVETEARRTVTRSFYHQLGYGADNLRVVMGKPIRLLQPSDPLYA